jgi:hypothetical protein
MLSQIRYFDLAFPLPQMGPCSSLPSCTNSWSLLQDSTEAGSRRMLKAMTSVRQRVLSFFSPFPSALLSKWVDRHYRNKAVRRGVGRATLRPARSFLFLQRIISPLILFFPYLRPLESRRQTC